MEYRRLTFTQLLKAHSVFREFVADTHEEGEGQGLEGGDLQVKTNRKQVCVCMHICVYLLPLLLTLTNLSALHGRQTGLLFNARSASLPQEEG